MFLQETYELIDAMYYNPLTDNHSGFSLSEGSANITHSSDGMAVNGTGNSNAMVVLGETLPTNFIAEYDVTGYEYGDYNASAEVVTSHTGVYWRKSSNTNYTTLINHSDDYSSDPSYTDYSRLSPPIHFKVRVENGTATYYYGNNTQLGSKASGNSDFLIRAYKNRKITIKNLVIKAL